MVVLLPRNEKTFNSARGRPHRRVHPHERLSRHSLSSGEGGASSLEGRQGPALFYPPMKTAAIKKAMEKGPRWSFAASNSFSEWSFIPSL